MEEIIVIAIAIGFFILVGVIGNYFEKKRTEAMKAVANRLQMDFARKDGQLAQALSFMSLFSRGHSKEIRNVFSGEADAMKIKIFDYKYVIGHSKGATTYEQTVFMASSTEFRHPSFSMHPESLWEKIKLAFGNKDINFDSHPQFSKMYWLTGDDEARIREYFTPERLSFFEQQAHCYAEGKSDVLLMYHPKKKEPGQISDFLAKGLQFVQVMRVS